MTPSVFFLETLSTILRRDVKVASGYYSPLTAYLCLSFHQPVPKLNIWNSRPSIRDSCCQNACFIRYTLLSLDWCMQHGPTRFFHAHLSEILNVQVLYDNLENRVANPAPQEVQYHGRRSEERGGIYSVENSDVGSAIKMLQSITQAAVNLISQDNNQRRWHHLTSPVSAIELARPGTFKVRFFPLVGLLVLAAALADGTAWLNWAWPEFLRFRQRD